MNYFFRNPVINILSLHTISATLISKLVGIANAVFWQLLRYKMRKYFISENTHQTNKSIACVWLDILPESSFQLAPNVVKTEKINVAF